MAVINDRAFNLPGVRQRAMGHGRPKPIGVTGPPPGKTGGISHWQQVELAAGTRIVRFGQKRLVPGRTSLSARGLFAGAAEGEWWLDQDEFDRIERHAEESGISIGHAIGTLCVVPQEWSDLDIMIVARLKQPLLALRGSPNAAMAGGKEFAAVRDNHHRLVKQLFIPGLGNPDVIHDALMIERQVFLHQKAAHRL